MNENKIPAKKKAIVINAEVNDNLCTLVQFGTGEIGIATGIYEETPMIVFKNISKRKVGELVPDEFTNKLETSKPEVVITFSNPESLDVLINFLMHIRNEQFNSPQPDTNEGL